MPLPQKYEINVSANKFFQSYDKIVNKINKQFVIRNSLSWRKKYEFEKKKTVKKH